MKNIKSLLSVLLMVAMLLATPATASAQKSVDPDCVTACFAVSMCQFLGYWEQVMCEFRCIGFCAGVGNSINQTATDGFTPALEPKESICTTNLRFMWKEKRDALLLKDYNGLTTRVTDSMFLPLRNSTSQ